MKKNIYQLIVILILFLSIPYIKADCTSEELKELKKETKQIKIIYEHMGKVTTEEGGTDYNKFSVDIVNIPDNYYIIVNDGLNYKEEPQNNKVNVILSNGSWTINIYSNKCESEIDTIRFKLPRFNIYSLDPLCEGVDGEKFPLCGKYYEYDVSYDSFKQRVEHYRTTNNIKKSNNSNDTENKKNYFEIIINYLNKYKLYIISGVGVIILITVITIIIKKRRNRGVLK